MKINMHSVNYDGTPNNNGKWWVWKEVCDRCGSTIYDEQTLHSRKEDNTEVDFCVKCMRYFMDNKIPYKEASILYGK